MSLSKVIMLGIGKLWNLCAIACNYDRFVVFILSRREFFFFSSLFVFRAIVTDKVSSVVCINESYYCDHLVSPNTDHRFRLRRGFLRDFITAGFESQVVRSLISIAFIIPTVIL